MNELKIVAVITARESCADDVLSALRTVTEETRKEEGNISYDLHQNVDNPLQFTIIETWKSSEAIDSHNESPHFAEFKTAIDGKIDALTIDVMKAL